MTTKRLAAGEPVSIPHGWLTPEQQMTLDVLERMEKIVSQINASLDHLQTSMAKEIADSVSGLQQQVDALGTQISDMSAKETLTEQELAAKTEELQSTQSDLAAKTSELAAAVARIDQMASELDANDAAPAPAPEQPTPAPEPAPVDQTPTDGTPVVEPAPVPQDQPPAAPVEDGAPGNDPTTPATDQPTEPVNPDVDPNANPTPTF